MTQFDPGRNLRRAQRQGYRYFDGLARGTRLGIALAIVAGIGLLAALILAIRVDAPPIYVDDRAAIRSP